MYLILISYSRPQFFEMAYTGTLYRVIRVEDESLEKVDQELKSLGISGYEIAEVTKIERKSR